MAATVKPDEPKNTLNSNYAKKSTPFTHDNLKINTCFRTKMNI